MPYILNGRNKIVANVKSGKLELNHKLVQKHGCWESNNLRYFLALLASLRRCD